MSRIPFGGRIPGRPATVVLALAGVVAGVLIGRPGLSTVVGCGIGSDDYPSQTAKDWVSYADHVVVASPTRERDTDRRDFTQGTHRYETDRTVTFRTDTLVWSADRPARALDKGFELTAPGWRVYRQSGNRVKQTAANAPRLETGHTYLLALRWSADGWTVLGEGAAVPFDDHTGNRGEWCGRVLSEDDVSRGEHFSRKDDDSLEKTLVGENEQAVTRVLERASTK